ncbi:TadE/TadG family type IV pilus assembly protein [Shewanella surugensis]|uniref:Pilus assembly protein n=1 Tax=Shewanella surugensis TaxID=212020 RepID=A0ABT0LHX6_9GAMM|nr:TadE family protein [Shewanella surugensis]MCL1127309.1 pilus assembly protein [Shewanella surugensis]
MKYQRGVYAVEFAIVGSIFLLLLFSIIEVSRLMYTYNVLHEASRRAARIAVVCQIGDTDIKTMGLFNGENLIPNLTTENLNISYLDESANVATGIDIVLVRADIVNYQHHFLVPGLSRVINSPTFSTYLPRESLGVYHVNEEDLNSGFIDCN